MGLKLPKKLKCIRKTLDGCLWPWNKESLFKQKKK
jgi:hypothetical protein